MAPQLPIGADVVATTRPLLIMSMIFHQKRTLAKREELSKLTVGQVELVFRGRLESCHQLPRAGQPKEDIGGIGRQDVSQPRRPTPGSTLSPPGTRQQTPFHPHSNGPFSSHPEGVGKPGKNPRVDDPPVQSSSDVVSYGASRSSQIPQSAAGARSFLTLEAPICPSDTARGLGSAGPGPGKKRRLEPAQEQGRASSSTAVKPHDAREPSPPTSRKKRKGNGAARRRLEAAPQNARAVSFTKAPVPVGGAIQASIQSISVSVSDTISQNCSNPHASSPPTTPPAIISNPVHALAVAVPGITRLSVDGTLDLSVITELLDYIKRHLPIEADRDSNRNHLS